MRRPVRWLLLVVVVLVVAGVGAAGLAITPDLGDARDRVDERWRALREPLTARYEALGGVATALADAGESERAVTVELMAVLERWGDLALRGPQHTDIEREVTTANELEALARRVRANIAGSALLNANEALKAALVAFDETAGVVPQPDVRAYNRAVRRYERERSGTPERLVAAALGYEPRSVLVLAG